MNKIRKMLILWLVAGVATLASAQWQNCNLTTGTTNGPVTALETNGSTMTFAGKAVGGIYRSVNSGTTWSAIVSGMSANSALTLFLRSGTLYAGTTNGVYTSSNNGGNWSNTVLNSVTVSDFAGNTNYTFAATSGQGVQRSTNNGNTWSPANTGLGSMNVLSLATAGTTLYAGTETAGMYRSSNDGTNWTAMNGNLPNEAVKSVFVTSNRTLAGLVVDGIYATSDSGRTWTAHNNGIGLGNVTSNFCQSFDYLFVATLSGVYVSFDEGDQWYSLNDSYVSSATSLTTNGVYLYAGQSNGTLWRRTLSSISAVSENPVAEIKSMKLLNSYPNPFNATTRIRFELAKPGKVSLTIINRSGEIVANLLQQNLAAGSHETEFNGLTLGSGIFFARLQSGSERQIQKLVLVK